MKYKSKLREPFRNTTFSKVAINFLNFSCLFPNRVIKSLEGIVCIGGSMNVDINSKSTKIIS